MARRLSLAICLWILAADAGAPCVAAGQTRTPPFRPEGGLGTPRLETDMSLRLPRLELWLKALMRHQPGANDDEAALVGSWSNNELRTLWIDANVLVQIMRGHGAANRFVVRSEGQKTAVQIRYTNTQLRRLNVLACAAGGVLVESECLAMRAGEALDEEILRLSRLARAARLRGDDNYILRRGALLHSDVAMLAPLASVEPGSTPPSVGPQRFKMEISDGRRTGLRQSAVHWEIARMLLDYVKPGDTGKPAPGRDAMVRQWYRAIAAWMQRQAEHESLHLDRAREIFPTDPEILFLSGCQHEAYAASPIQSALKAAVLPTGVSLDIGSERAELRAAESFFRRTLELKPDLDNSRLKPTM